MSFNEIYKQSTESNNIILQINEANALQEIKTRNKEIIKISFKYGKYLNRTKKNK